MMRLVGFGVRSASNSFTSFASFSRIVCVAALRGISTSSATMTSARDPVIWPVMPADFTEGACAPSRADVERQVRVALSLAGLQVCERRHLVDEALGEDGEVVGAALARGDHENLQLRVHEEEPADEGRRDP
jgi:hypothetical protein